MTFHMFRCLSLSLFKCSPTKFPVIEKYFLTLKAPIMSSVEIRMVMQRLIAKIIFTVVLSRMSMIIVFHSTFAVKIRIKEMIASTCMTNLRNIKSHNLKNTRTIVLTIPHTPLKIVPVFREQHLQHVLNCILKGEK